MEEEVLPAVGLIVGSGLFQSVEMAITIPTMTITAIAAIMKGRYASLKIFTLSRDLRRGFEGRLPRVGWFSIISPAFPIIIQSYYTEKTGQMQEVFIAKNGLLLNKDVFLAFAICLGYDSG
jgi:hypothetical protein